MTVLKGCKFAAMALLLSVSWSTTTFAHSGGTNANGCHMNHYTRDYHCHQARTPSYGQVTYCLHVNFKKYCGYAYSTCSQLRNEYGGMCVQDY